MGKRLRKHALVFVISSVLIILFLVFLPLRDPLRVNYSQIIRFRDGKVMRVYRTGDDFFRIYVKLEDVDPDFIRALICYEDKRFNWHPGVDPVAVFRAFFQNVRAKRIVSGASTLAMQVARLTYPSNRTFFAKIREGFLGILYTFRYGRKGILERYLNRAPYGGNIEGIGAAVWRYFHHGPEVLSLNEQAVLLALPQSPSRRKPSPKNRQRLMSARNRVLQRLYECGLISREEMEKTSREGVPISMYPFPAYAPHASDVLARRYVNRMNIVSTLDFQTQLITERIVRRAVPSLRRKGINQVVVVVIDNSTRSVSALIGSVDYWSGEWGSQFPGFLALRSPGSALKPFLVALALEKGLVSIRSLLPDVPLRFPGFAPQNYTLTYEGLVPVEKALRQSMNIPMIHLLRKVRVSQFLEVLRRGGLRIPIDRSYGLSVITGAVEVTPLALTNLYVTLARNGQYGPVRFTVQDEFFEQPLFHPGAIELVRKILSQRSRPEWTAPIRDLKIAWKTGTSWGRRDAWSLGVTHEWTIGVWVGNFSGKGNKFLVGQEVASPIMFDLFRALHKTTPISREDTRPVLGKVRVCAFSGYAPRSFCPETIWVDHPLNSRLLTHCPYHTSLWIEKHTGNRACPGFEYAHGELVQKTFLILPEHIRAYFREQVPSLPSYAQGCPEIMDFEGLKILQPTDRSFYVLTHTVPNAHRLSLVALSSEDPIYWYIDGRLVATSASNESVSVHLPDGEHKILAVNMNGQRDAVRVRILYEDTKHK